MSDQINWDATVTIRIVTAPGTNASRVGSSHECWENCGPLSAGNAVDQCDSDGFGRVFLSGIDLDAVEFVSEQLDADNDVVSYSVV